MAKRLVVPIIADSSAFKRGLKESTAAANQFDAKIKSLHGRMLSLGRAAGITSAAMGAGGFVLAVKGSIQAASDLHEQINKADVVFRSSSKEVVEWSATTAKALGVSRREALEYAGTFGNMLVPMGYARKASADMSVQLVKLASDMASFNNANPQDVLAALQSGLTGQVRPLRQYGVALSDARERQVLMDAGVKGLGATLTAGQRSWAAYQIILTDTKDAQGDFARTSGGLANQQRILKAEVENLEASIGRLLLPTVVKIVTAITGWLDKSDNQKKVMDGLRETIRIFSVVLGDLKESFDKVFPLVERLKNAFGDWKPLIVAAGAALVALGVLSPWTALAVGAVYVITHWQKVKSWFKDLWARLKAGFAIVWDALKIDAVQTALAMVEPFSHLPAFLGGWARDAKKRLNTELDGVESDMGKHTATITAAWGQAGKQAGDTWADNIVRSLTANQARIAAAAGVTSDSASSATNDSRGQGGHSTGASKMSASEVKALVRKAGGSAAEADYLAAISGKESGRDSTVINDNLKTHDYSVGLFQINFRDMQNRWMRGGKPAAMALQKDPLAQARYALGLLHSQGPSAWSTNTPAIQALLGGGGGGGGGGAPGGPPADSASTAAAEKAKTAAEKKAAAAAKAAASAAYRSWKENYFTPLDNEYKSDLLVTDESKRLNKLQALHAKLAIDEKKASGKERQDLFNEETKVAGKIKSLREKMANEQKAILAKQHAAYVKGLQDDLSAAQTSLARQQTVFDRAWSRIAAKITGAFNKATQAGLAAIQAKYGVATPEEQARDDFQAQLDAAQRAADLGSAQNDLIAAQLAGDPEAVRQAQAHLGDVQNQQKIADLQAAADKSRAIANAASDKEQADYQAARDDQLQNLNDWLDDQKAALEAGTETWAEFWQGAFSDAPAKYAPDAVSSLQGVIDQLQKIKDLQDKINNATGGGGGGGSISLPGGLTVPAGVIGHGFGGSFAAGGVVPGSLGQPMMILAHGGERVIPNGGGGGHTFNISFPQYVGSREELARTLRDELVTLGRREPNIFGGFA